MTIARKNHLGLSPSIKSESGFLTVRSGRTSSGTSVHPGILLVSADSWRGTFNPTDIINCAREYLSYIH